MPSFAMRSCLAGALVAGALGCGARSELRDGAGSGGAGGSTLPAKGCTAAFAPGALTPITGYCSTRAYRAPGAFADDITTAWQEQIGGMKGVSEIVVDANGRAYVSMDLDEQSDAVLPQTIKAVDPDGTIVWTRTFMGTVAGLMLLADGNLHFNESPQRLRALTRDGKDTGGVVDLPADAMAIGVPDSKGALYFLRNNWDGDLHVEKIDPGGAVDWTSPNLGNYIARPALDASDHVVVTSLGDSIHDVVLTKLDVDGSVLWARHFVGDSLSPPAVGPGDVVYLSYAESAGTVHVAATSSAGDAVYDTILPEPSPQNAWGSPLAIASDGVALARTSSWAVALSALGQILWASAIDESLEYGASVDDRSTFVIASGTVVALDGEGGSQRFAAPVGETICNEPVALGPGGAMYIGGCDGSLRLDRPTMPD